MAKALSRKSDRAGIASISLHDRLTIIARKIMRQGFRVHTCLPCEEIIYSPLSRIKSLNYLDNILGRIEAREHNAQEAFF